MKNKIILWLYLLLGATIISNAQAKLWNNLNTNNGSVLLELSCFTATPYKCYNTISWSTEKGIEDSYFILEKSADGINFEAFSTMKSSDKSTVPLNYVVLDNEPFKEYTYYRLKQTSFNSLIKYSDIITLSMADTESNACSNSSEKTRIFRLTCGTN